ncbi:MAG: four helix bundle protein, partial [Longimicrobiales bacterium]
MGLSLGLGLSWSWSLAGTDMVLPLPAVSVGEARAGHPLRNGGAMALAIFRVYRLALEFAATAVGISGQARRKRRLNLAEQSLRAAESIVLNIAEGAGEFAPGEKVRFYRMALRSATECEAALALVRAEFLAAPTDLDRAEALLSLSPELSHLVAACRARGRPCDPRTPSTRRAMHPTKRNAALLILAAFTACVSTPTPGDVVPPSTARGHLFIVGGGSRPPELMSRFVELAGGPGEAAIVVVPLASASPEEAGQNMVEGLEALGAE